MAEEPFIVISNAQVYGEIQKVRDDLLDLGKKIDHMNGHESRIRALELKFYAVLAGVITAALIYAGVQVS